VVSCNGFTSGVFETLFRRNFGNRRIRTMRRYSITFANHFVGTVCNIPTASCVQAVWRSMNSALTTHQFNTHYSIFKNVLDLWVLNRTCMFLTLLIMYVWSTSVITYNGYHICDCNTSFYVFFSDTNRSYGFFLSSRQKLRLTL
jgi:hypothetical protein